MNASLTAPTGYFIAKARLDEVIRGSGMSHAIVRPTLTFGPGDILVNNLCWVLRRFPAFAIPGRGIAFSRCMLTTWPDRHRGGPRVG